MNVLTIAGLIQHTPRVHNTRGGERVLNLNVGVRQRAKKDGAWVNETLWLDVTVFGTRADALGGILKKGGQIGATGELRVRKYEGRDGTPKQAVELLASNVWPLDWTPRPEMTYDREQQHRDELAGDRTRTRELMPRGSSLDSAGDFEVPPDDDQIPF